MRCPAIRRIHHERSLLAGTPRALSPVVGRAGTHAGVGYHSLHQIVFVLLLDLFLPVSQFLLGIVGPVAEIRGAVHRRTDAIVAGPGALQIRIAPRRLQLHPMLVRGRGFGRLGHQHGNRGSRHPDDESYKSVFHAKSPFTIQARPCYFTRGSECNEEYETIIKPMHPLPSSSWSPASWRQKTAEQQVSYASKADLDRALDELSQLPPLVTSWEIETLKAQLAEAAQGRRFLLQGGDCAESFDECTADGITNKLKVLLQMSLVLVHGGGKPVIAHWPDRGPVRQTPLRRFRNARRREAAQLSRRSRQSSRLQRH